MAAKIRKGDKVVVLTGRDKGRTGEVIEVRPAEGRALVRGVNMVKRHQKQTAQQEGGIISKEAPIHLSNLALADPKDGKPTRVGFKSSAGRDARRCASPSVRESRSMADTQKTRPKAQADKAARQGRSRRPQGASEAAGAARPRRRPRASRTIARLHTHYESVRGSSPSSSATRTDAGAGIDKVVLNMGIGEAVERPQEGRDCRRRSCADRRPEGGHHQVAQVDRDLQAARRPGRSAARSRCARRACTSSSTGWSTSRCRACATSAGSIRRASTAAATTRSASRNTSCSRRSTTTRSTDIWGMDITVCTTARTDDEARALLTAFNFPFRQ